MSQGLPGLPEQKRGQTIMILGICSIVVSCCGCGWILGPAIWYLANTDLKKINLGQIPEDQRKPTQTGMYCAMAGTAFGVLWLILACAGTIFNFVFNK
jgi:hypothetical protein